MGRPFAVGESCRRTFGWIKCGGRWTMRLGWLAGAVGWRSLVGGRLLVVVVESNGGRWLVVDVGGRRWTLVMVIAVVGGRRRLVVVCLAG